MPKVTTSQSNFSNGEISPEAYGRWDLAKFANSAKVMLNFIVNQLGGGFFRTGTRYVAETSDSTKASRLMPFQYSADQDYVLEIGHLYIRVYSNDATLVNVTQFTSVYPTAQSDTYVKATTKISTDYWPYYATDPTKSLTGTWAGNAWRSDAATTDQRFHIDLGSAKVATRIYYENGINGSDSTPGAKTFTIWGSNTAAAFAELTYGTDTNWTQITAASGTFEQHSSADVADPKYIEITNSTAYRYYAFKFADNYGGTQMSVRRLVMQTTLTSTDVTTTYLEADIFSIMQAHRNDVKYLTHSSYAVQKLTRTSATAFAIAAADIVRGPFLDDNITAVTLAPSNGTGTGIDVVASSDTFEAGHVGSLWKIKSGVVKITTVTDATNAVADVQAEPDGTAGDLEQSSATTDWAEGAFSGVRGYPSAVAFHDGRLYYGGTTHEPQKIWGSAVNAYDSFDKGTEADDDAVTFEIATEERNAINWLMSGRRNLTIGTSGGTFSASGASEAPITPDSIQITRDTNYGVASLAPKRLSSFIYYIQRNLNKLREISYDFNSDTNMARDMNLLAAHIIKDGDGAVDIDYQQAPNDRMWCVRDDGIMAVLTRNPEQEVTGWCRLQAGTDSTQAGKFESVAVIPKQDEADQIWVVVNRTIGGTTKRFIEFFTPEDFDDDWDAIRLDSSVTRDTAITMTAATAADPVVVTAGTHGLSDGDQIKIDNVVGMTELNGNEYIVASKTADTFELKTVNSLPWDVESNNLTALPDDSSEAYPWHKTTAGIGAWTRVADGDALNGYRATQTSSTTAATDRAYYAHNVTGDPFHDDVDNSKGYTIAVRLKVVTYGSTRAADIQVRDGAYGFLLFIKNDEINVNAAYLAESTQTYTMDTTDAYHVYEIVVKGTSLTVLVDGVSRITGTLDSATANKYILLGDTNPGANRGGVVYWDYIKYKISTDSEDVDGSDYTTYISDGEIREMSTGVTGLLHLETETVEVQADGVALTETFTVSSGAILLTTKAAVTHTGLPYDGTIQLLKFSDGSATGTGQTKNRRIYLSTIRVDRSLSMKVGLTEDTLDTVNFGDTNSEVVTALQTKDLEKFFQTWWSKDGELIIRQDKPNPLNVLGVVVKSEVSEK